VKYLLDTHTLLWARLNPQKLSVAHREIILARDTEKYISSLNIWEISLKFSIGKLELGTHNPDEFLASALSVGFMLAEPTAQQYASFYKLPEVIKHKDPFDRMLIWHTITSNMTLLSSDKRLPEYGVHGLKLA
jgi:PIN domain nuclease of toxin-antitoxin system